MDGRRVLTTNKAVVKDTKLGKYYRRCDWCGGGDMRAIGTEYYPCIITHCTKCHHEGVEVDSAEWEKRRGKR